MKEDKMGGACSLHGDRRSVYNILVGKTGGKRPLGRCMYKREDNVKMDLRKMRLEDVDWIHVARDRN
jgi:hypothetical protein